MEGKVADGHEAFEFLARELTLRADVGGRESLVVVDASYVKKLSLNLVGDALGLGLPREVCRLGLRDKSVDAAAFFGRLEDAVRPDHLPDLFSDFGVGLRLPVFEGELRNLFKARLAAALSQGFDDYVLPSPLLFHTCKVPSAGTTAAPGASEVRRLSHE